VLVLDDKKALSRKLLLINWSKFDPYTAHHSKRCHRHPCERVLIAEFADMVRSIRRNAGRGGTYLF
jgi:hypothetical protein